MRQEGESIIKIKSWIVRPEKEEGYNIMYESKKVQTFESDVRLEISRNFEQDIDIFDDIDISEKKSLSSLSGDNLSLPVKETFHY